MRPQVITQTGTGSTAWIPLDYKQNPFNIGLGVVVNGTITYDVELTFDNVFSPSVTPVAFKHATLVAQTANASSGHTIPIRAIRINNTAGTGDTTLTIIQGQR